MRYLFLVLIMSVKVFASVEDFAGLIRSASDDRLGMKMRWGALMKAAEFAHPEQIHHILKFSANKDWYMRNASLIALNKVSRLAALDAAKKLIQDKALVVRSAAVEILAANMNDENKNLLQEEMNKSYNFNKSSSLWIRKQILEKLSKTAGFENRDFFVRSLFDSDKEIAQLSANVLSKITGEQFDKSESVDRWKTLVKQKNWL